jgi:hypothetical protein
MFIIMVVRGRFRGEVGVVKVCIEGLIDKGFLGREGGGYVYVS